MHFDLASLGDPALRPAAALLLGCAIGFERQWNQKMAGLRTNALVALGASGFVVFSGLVGEGDPTRIAAQVVTGIGFLGAGVILREGINVHGLNTAATLWCSAMVGTLAGAGLSQCARGRLCDRHQSLPAAAGAAREQSPDDLK
jgi:putative Mg2+ transporter-C (MgtC) family protein